MTRTVPSSMATSGDTRRMDGSQHFDPHALVLGEQSDSISFSMACLPWNRWPEGLIHSPESLQCAATALASPRL